MFGDSIAIAFSGAEDVALIEYAKLTGRPFRVFSLDTGRLNPDTYEYFDTVERRYGIHTEYMFPEADEVLALVRSNGLFSSYEDGHQECCRVRKVRPLRKALKAAKECGLHKGNISQDGAWEAGANGDGVAAINSVNGSHDIFQSRAIVNFTRPGIENLLRLESRKEAWLVVLYAPRCRFCQAMGGSYTELAENLSGRRRGTRILC